MAFTGADTDQLRRLATQMDLATHSLDETAKSLTALMNSDSNWRGHDADRFRSQWYSSDKSSLMNVVSALRDSANTLRRNADEQDAASSPAAGGAGGIGRGPSPSSTAGLFDAIKHHAPESHDGVRIQRVMGADGKERFIVYLDGTDSAPGRYSIVENVPAALGMSTETRKAIIDEMRDHGITKGSEVMMVGYSQGGLYAQSIAQSGDFGSPVVVTFGSPMTGHVEHMGTAPPTATADIPRAGVDVVRLEANNDEVLRLANPFGASHAINEGVRDLFGAGGNDTTFRSGSHDLPASDGEALRTGNFPGLFGAHSDNQTYENVGKDFDRSTDHQYDHVRDRMSPFMNATVLSDTDPG